MIGVAGFPILEQYYSLAAVHFDGWKSYRLGSRWAAPSVGSKRAIVLDLRLGRRQITGRGFALEVEFAVFAVAERLVFGMAAATKAQASAACQAECVSLLIADL